MHLTGRELNLTDFIKYSSTFVETGAAVGDGIQRALDAGYGSINSIELKKDYYNHCVYRFKNNSIVKILFGKSVDVLRYFSLVSAMIPIVFFLDAHPSGPGSAGHDQLMKEGSGSEFDQHEIIKQEIDIILARQQDDVIIIDDQQGINDITRYYKRLVIQQKPKYVFEFYNKFSHENSVMVCRPE